jgi:hypothetical protein
MTNLDKYIGQYHNTEDFKKAVSSFVVNGLEPKGTMSKKQVQSLIEDAIDWGIRYADAYPNKLN